MPPRNSCQWVRCQVPVKPPRAGLSNKLPWLWACGKWLTAAYLFTDCKRTRRALRSSIVLGYWQAVESFAGLVGRLGPPGGVEDLQGV